VADEDGRAADPAQRADHGGDVALGGVEGVLGGHHLVSLGLQCGDHLVEARAVGPDPVDEDDTRFVLRGHGVLLNSIDDDSAWEAARTSLAGPATAIPHAIR
jgi:hypothetical protein